MPATLTDAELVSLPCRARDFAIATMGPVAAGVTPKHVIAVGSYLGSQGIERELLYALTGKAYEYLLAESQSYDG